MYTKNASDLDLYLFSNKKDTSLIWVNENPVNS